MTFLKKHDFKGNGWILKGKFGFLAKAFLPSSPLCIHPSLEEIVSQILKPIGPRRNSLPHGSSPPIRGVRTGSSLAVSILINALHEQIHNNHL